MFESAGFHKIPFDSVLALLLADDHRYRNISHILTRWGFPHAVDPTAPTAPRVFTNHQNTEFERLISSFFGQTRVAPPPTGSPSIQRQKGTNNVSGTIQQPDSQRTHHPFLEPAGILRDDLMRIRNGTRPLEIRMRFGQQVSVREDSPFLRMVSSAGDRVEQAQYERRSIPWRYLPRSHCVRVAHPRKKT